MSAAALQAAAALPLGSVLLQTYGVLLSRDGFAKCAEGLPASETQNHKRIFDRLIDLNITAGEGEGGAAESALTLPGAVQRDMGSLPAAQIKQLTFFQIEASRDVTQPLRACSDDDNEELWGAAQNMSLRTRLLKLMLTDGHVSVPAVELTTLKKFKSIPIPGEKLILKDFEVKSGMIILTDESIHFYGGNVEELRKEFFLIRDRRARGVHGKAGLEGAPKFEQFHASAAFDSRVKTIDAAAGRSVVAKRSHERPPAPSRAADAPTQATGTNSAAAGGHSRHSDTAHHHSHAHGQGQSHDRGHGHSHSHHGHNHGRGHSHGHGHPDDREGSRGRGHGRGRERGPQRGRGHEERAYHRDPYNEAKEPVPAKVPPPSAKCYDDDWPELN